MNFDDTGKISFNHIYTQVDPRAYFHTLHDLDYCIPQLAKPYFLRLIQEYRESQRIRGPKIVDIGCSYGINAALLKCDMTMHELYRRYCDDEARTRSRSALLARDRELVRTRNRLEHTRFIGLDSAQPALAYAVAAGFLDDAVHADLEANDPAPGQRALLEGTDIIISTGCMGYVTDKTLGRVIAASGARKPWMAHFVLRMFPVEAMSDTLSDLGYETLHVERVFKQRRFSSPQEQAQILDTLADSGIDSYGLEADGWLYARLHLSRPRASTVPALFAELRP